MTNEELQDAIVMTHAAIKGSAEFSPTKAHLELHMRELLRIQRERASIPGETPSKEKQEQIATCSLNPPREIT